MDLINEKKTEWFGLIRFIKSSTKTKNKNCLKFVS
jgi:hypothetical protein